MRPVRISMRQAGVLSLLAFFLITSAARSNSITGGVVPDQTGSLGPVSTIDVSRDKGSVGYNNLTTVKGRINNGQKDTPVVLERQQGIAWTELAHTVTTEGGNYSFKIQLKESSDLRIRAELAGYSASRRIGVRAGIDLNKKSFNLYEGSSKKGRIKGVLQPGQAGRAVYLQIRKEGQWTTIDSVHTKARGKFSFGLPSSITTGYGIRKTRVMYQGDTANLGSAANIKVLVYRSGGFSHYGNGFSGTGACGTRIGPGALVFAHKTLPCGTKVTFYNNGKSAEGVVADRGPYIAGRDFDFSWTLKEKLGLGDVGSVNYVVN